MRSVHVGEWGSLVIYDADDGPPEGLRGASDCWSDDARRRPVVLRFGGRQIAYIGVWPGDAPPPPEGQLTERELEGVVLARPVTHHVCAACGATV